MQELMKPIEFVSVTLAEARRELVGAPPKVTPSDWEKRRAARVEESLLPATAQWIDELPAEVQPLDLALKYARIANRICELWDDDIRCASYLSDLMIIRRATRQGFPPDVAMEIGALNVYYATLHPPRRAWT
jgi:hypothetical protein